MKTIVSTLATILLVSCSQLGLQRENDDSKETANLAIATSTLALAQSASVQFPAAFVYKNTVTALANGSTDFIFFNTVSYDTGSFFSASASDRVTVPSDGVYFIQGWLAFAPNATGSRKIILYLNTDATGSTGSIISLIVSPASSAGEESVLATDTILRLVKGDYVKLRAYQSSGGSLNLTVSGYSQVLYIRKLTN